MYIVILTSENGFSAIIYCFFRGRQNISLTMFSSKFAVKCPAQMFNNFICKNNFNRNFSVLKSLEGRSLFSGKNLKVRKFYPKCLNQHQIS